MPHAGLEYSGRCAAYAYSTVDFSKIETVVILGPSHHSPLRKCAFSLAKYYQTPLGSLALKKVSIE